MNREIEKRIYKTYPVTKDEKTCAQEKRRRDELRDLLRKRLYDESGAKEKRERGNDDQPQV